MTVAYSSDEAQTLELAIAMFAASTTWRSLLSAGTSALAKVRIVELDGGLDVTEAEATVNCLGQTITAVAPLLVISSLEHPAEERALASERRSGEFKARLYLAQTAGDTAPEHTRRATNTAGAIRAEIRDLFGTAGYLMRGSIDWVGPYLGDDVGQWSTSMIVEFTLRWRA